MSLVRSHRSVGTEMTVQETTTRHGSPRLEFTMLYWHPASEEPEPVQEELDLRAARHLVEVLQEWIAEQWAAYLRRERLRPQTARSRAGVVAGPGPRGALRLRERGSRALRCAVS